MRVLLAPHGWRRIAALADSSDMINIFLNSTLLSQESQLSYASALFLLGLICHEPDPPISMVQVLPMLIAIGLTLSDSMKRRRLGGR